MKCYNIRKKEISNKPSKIDKTSLNVLIKKEKEIPAITNREEKEDKQDNLDEKDLDAREENDLIHEKETTIIEEVTKHKMYIKFLKDDKSLIKHVINLMIRNKKSEIRIPE